MPVKVRLMRIGTKKQPFYRIVAVDERKKRTGAYLELLGTYNPLTEPKQINLKQDRIDDWVKKGAVLSDGFLRATGKAPQRPPRKPKKEKAAPAILPSGDPQPSLEEAQRAEVTDKPQEESAPIVENASEALSEEKSEPEKKEQE